MASVYTDPYTYVQGLYEMVSVVRHGMPNPPRGVSVSLTYIWKSSKRIKVPTSFKAVPSMRRSLC